MANEIEIAFKNACEQTIIDLNSGMLRKGFLKAQNTEGNT
jgi:ubiquinone/menaquinone biosynthesis C-methylase UbiE